MFKLKYVGLNGKNAPVKNFNFRTFRKQRFSSSRKSKLKPCIIINLIFVMVFNLKFKYDQLRYLSCDIDIQISYNFSLINNNKQFYFRTYSL